jgi:hypothetical protein
MEERTQLSGVRARDISNPTSVHADAEKIFGLNFTTDFNLRSLELTISLVIGDKNSDFAIATYRHN